MYMVMHERVRDEQVRMNGNKQNFNKGCLLHEIRRVIQKVNRAACGTRAARGTRAAVFP